MHKKGFAHIIPILLIALLVTTGLVGLSISSDNAHKQAVGKVLSDKDEQQKQALEQAQETTKNQQEQLQGSAQKALENQKEQNKNNSTQNSILNTNPNTKFEIDTENGKVKIKAKNGNNEFESESQGGTEEAKLQMDKFKVEVHREGDKFVTKIKDTNGKDVELESSQEAEILDKTEKELEDDDIKIATGSADLGFIQKGNKVRTNFPLSVNPQNGILTITTPSGEKDVTVLPDEAIDNMKKAGVITEVEAQTETSSTLGATSSPQTVTNAAIELTTRDNKPVYIISGLKDKRFLGLIPVSIRLKTVVSTENGSLVAINEDLLTRILDLVSF